MAGFVVVSMCAAAREEFGTTHWKWELWDQEEAKTKLLLDCLLFQFQQGDFITWADGPQKTLTKANWDGKEETVLVSPWKNPYSQVLNPRQATNISNSTCVEVVADLTAK